MLNRLIMDPKHYKFIILGSGQAAPPLAQALTAAHGKQSTLIVEKAFIGGTCINYGCTPTKTMIASGRAAYTYSRREEFGIRKFNSIPRVPDGAVDMAVIKERMAKIVKNFRGSSEDKLKISGVDVQYGEARFIGPKNIVVTANATGRETEYTADQIFINTGCRPAESQLPGASKIDPKRLLNSTTIMELTELPRKLIVVGAGYVGLEFAQLFKRLGSDVTIVGRSETILAREDENVSNELFMMLGREEIDFELGIIMLRLENDKSLGTPRVSLVYKPTPLGGHKSILATHILWATGRVPNTDMLDAAKGGIQLDEKGFIKCDEYLKTTAEGVYVMGDVKGGPAFTHISYDDFRILKNNILSPDAPKLSTKNRMVPYTVYTDPQLGHIGVHEHDVRKTYPGRKIKVAQMPMKWVARAIETDEKRGLMKAIVDGDTEEILGFTCLGIEGGEIMSMVQIAMMGGLKYSQLRDATFAHPTLAESLNNLWAHLEDLQEYEDSDKE
ncbi:hypothetical protein TWF730_007384 [Orbilia blumenaviensis]|uniref:Mercuric reductase n=1 Tax=Orbilia blumenaviensis TaxID=1796055 RepID=A0AAV9VE27_9PEZI